MTRVILALLAVVVTICLTSSIDAAPQENVVGKVFFLEGGKLGYLRQSVSEGSVKAESLSGGDTAAAIAVLLGAPPPLLLSPASSARLDSLLSPNPFKRPHAVVALTVRGVTSDSPVFEEIQEILGSSFVQQRSLSANGFQRPHELPGQDVELQSLNSGESAYGLEHGLDALASFLEGAYKKDEDTDKIMLQIPLPHADKFFFSMNLEKNADRKFAEDLVQLFHATQSVSSLRRDQIQGKLILGTFTALELMEEGSDHRVDATKLLLHTAARVLSALEAKYNGEMIGVFTLLSSTSGTRVLPLFRINESRSSRSLLGDVLAPAPSPASPNQSLYDAQIKILNSRSLLVVTALILLIATGMGSCFLAFMPLTRDTLLYAAVKLD